MKYIDSEKLIAEIERKKEYALEHYHNQGDIQSAYNICCEILSSIESLQQKQPEVDFEDKFAKFLEKKMLNLALNLGARKTAENLLNISITAGMMISSRRWIWKGKYVTIFPNGIMTLMMA